MSVIIVDEFTGRLMVGRQWTDGLHQAVEAKHAREGVKIKEETQTLATITLQNYFKLYKKLAGMTGTAMTEANEFWKIYKLDVIAIPTNKPLIRVNYPDVIYLTEKEKWDAVVTRSSASTSGTWSLNDGTTARHDQDETEETSIRAEGATKQTSSGRRQGVERKGRPMLIGTTDVDKSEKLSDMLKRRGIKHELLNAKPEYAAREAEIVAQAGRIGAVTIATNMAGRGTDIILGGNPETLAWARLKDKYATRLDVPEDVWKQTVEEIETKEKMKEEGRKVAEMGGLHIIGTERHEARRIDNQLRGRAGRQGDPGSSRFYLSLQDDLMRIFAGEWVASVLHAPGHGGGPGHREPHGVAAHRGGPEEGRGTQLRHPQEPARIRRGDGPPAQAASTATARRSWTGPTARLRILDMIDEQIDLAVGPLPGRRLRPGQLRRVRRRTGWASSSTRRTFAPQRLRPRRSRRPATRRSRMMPTQIHEAMDENLSTDVETERNGTGRRWPARSTPAGA